MQSEDASREHVFVLAEMISVSQLLPREHGKQLTLGQMRVWLFLLACLPTRDRGVRKFHFLQGLHSRRDGDPVQSLEILWLGRFALFCGVAVIGMSAMRLPQVVSW